MCMLSTFLTLCSCSLPDVSIDKKQKREDAAGAGFFQKTDDHATDIHANDQTYVATVRVKLTPSSTDSFSFDVRRDKRDLVSVNLEQTEETSTYLHLGYAHSEGGIAGLRFTFRF